MLTRVTLSFVGSPIVEQGRRAPLLTTTLILLETNYSLYLEVWNGVLRCGMKNPSHLFIGFKMSNARSCIGLHGCTNTSGIKQGTKDSVPEPGEARQPMHDRAMICLLPRLVF
ncbi:hypothetical protein L1987_15137 [Smallanthus sonchifolius]|uniref:Uncharacterized protein n=1 Tax=Smallanthus sonchifolius TaxID=185202 RepID=A0ACB9J4M4_9ASTR|nr:hypothetical protein L1987_15137 [Smallanthus sonchifolius]